MTCAFAAALSLCPAARAQSLMGRNLVVNGDAEDGTGISSFEDTPVSPKTWTVKGKLTLAQYDGADLFNSLDGIPPKDHGKNYFSGGTEGKASSATQTISVNFAGADNISLMLSNGTMYGGNLMRNGDARCRAGFTTPRENCSTKRTSNR
ncbi:MAG: hypothetical protein M1541_21225 [Acidobacteria bacterium]|nr:hypothetical protein [Acidobacteriota bacterium]